MATRQAAISVSSEKEREQDGKSSESHTPSDVEGDLRKYRQCGRGCCGTPWDSDIDECVAEDVEGESSNEGGENKPYDSLIKPDSSSNALAYFNAAPAAPWTSVPPPVHPMTALDKNKIVTDEHVKLLVVSYRCHFAEHCAHKHRRLVQRYPYVVWKKVHADFLTKFPATNFDVFVLKSHLKAGLHKYKSPPPVMHVCASQKKKQPVKPTPAAKVTPVAVKSALSLSPVVNAPSFSLGVNWERMAAAQVPYPLAVAAVAQIMAAAYAQSTPTTVTQEALALNAKPRYGARTNDIIPADAYSLLSKNAQIEPAANSMPPAPAVVVQQKQVLALESGPLDDGNGVCQVTAADQTNTEGNSAPQSDSASTASPSHEPLGSSSPQVRSLKHRMRTNRLGLQELKRQKLSLEILNLALGLGVFTREECAERGRCMWFSWKPS